MPRGGNDKNKSGGDSYGKGRSHEKRAEETEGFTSAEEAAIKERVELWKEQQGK